MYVDTKSSIVFMMGDLTVLDSIWNSVVFQIDFYTRDCAITWASSRVYINKMLLTYKKK